MFVSLSRQLVVFVLVASSLVIQPVIKSGSLSLALVAVRLRLEDIYTQSDGKAWTSWQRRALIFPACVYISIAILQSEKNKVLNNSWNP